MRSVEKDSLEEYCIDDKHLYTYTLYIYQVADNKKGGGGTNHARRGEGLYIKQLISTSN